MSIWTDCNELKGSEIKCWTDPITKFIYCNNIGLL